MELNLRGRKAFVTGASRGIGAAIARGLAEEGVDVALFTRNPTDCEDLARELRNENSIQAPIIQLDLLERDRIKPAVAEGISALGEIDILVNNAAGFFRGGLTDIPEDILEQNFMIKPIGLMRMTRECAPYLEKSDQARIINLSGTRGREPSPYSMLSGPINMGTNSVTKAMANLFGAKGITVNAICPGSTDTDRWDDLVERTMRDHDLDKDDAERRLCAEVPLRCVIRMVDVADLAVFLASSRASRITGTAINVDGGRTRSI